MHARLDRFGRLQYEATQEKSHQPARNELVPGQQEYRGQRNGDAPPGRFQSEPTEQEKHAIQHRFDGNRPGRPVEGLIDGGRQPLLRQEQARDEMLPVVCIEDEEFSRRAEEERLQHGHNDEGREMQGIKPRETQQRKPRGRHAVFAYRLAIEPEEHEARQREEQVDRDPALLIEGFKQPEQWLRLASPACSPRATDGEEMLPVPDHHGERRDAPKRVERIKPFHAFPFDRRKLSDTDDALPDRQKEWKILAPAYAATQPSHRASTF